VFAKLRTNVLQLSVVRCSFCCSLVYGYIVFIVHEGWLCYQSVCLYSALHAVHAEQFVNFVPFFSISHQRHWSTDCVYIVSTVCSRNVDSVEIYSTFYLKKQQRRNRASQYSLRLLNRLHPPLGKFLKSHFGRLKVLVISIPSNVPVDEWWFIPTNWPWLRRCCDPQPLQTFNI